MKIYVGPLPHNVTHRAIKAFFSGYDKNIHIQIRQLKHDNADTIIYAYISVIPDRFAQKLIKKFNGSMFKGKPVLVREFMSRASGNDRRALGWRDKPWRFFDRRNNDRRKFRATQVLEEQWIAANRAQSPFQDSEKNAGSPKQRRAV